MKRAWILLASAAIALAASSCKKDEPKSTRWDNAAASAASAAQAPASASAVASAEPAKAGGSFNKFFPADGVDGTKRVFSQEKDGFAEAKLQKDGKEIAVLSVSDTQANQDARDKFKSATDKVQGHPVIAVGKNQSAMLVKDRWQVKVSSQSLDHEARKQWLGKFDVAGLASL